MVLSLRIKGLSTAQFRDVLLMTDEDGALYPAVQFVASGREGREYVVDLKIAEFREGLSGTKQRIPRDPLDKLLDMLNAWPRKTADIPQEIVDLVGVVIHNSTAMIGTIAETEVGRQDLRKQLLREVEAIYQAEKKFLKYVHS